MKVKRNSILLLFNLVVVVMLLVGIAACGGQAAQPAQEEPVAQQEEAVPTKEAEPTKEEVSEKEPVTLTVWSWRTEDEDAYNEIFDVYEAQNPGVTVEFVAFVNTDYNNILSTGLTGEGGPDVAQLRAYGGIQPLVEAGQLMPLDGEVATLSNFPDAILKGATGQSDGRIYGVPFGVQAFTAYYNKAIFDELGLSEPETWDEFIATLDALKEGGYIPISAPAKDVWMLPLIHDAVAAPRYGGPEFEAEVLSGATDFNDPDYVASIGVIQDLQQYLPDDVVGVGYTDSKTLFLTEQAGIFLGGSFEVGFWRNEGPDLDLGVFRVPAPPESLTGPLVPGWMDGSYGVNALSDAPDEAKKLVEWMGTPEFGQMFTEKIKQLSAIPDMSPTDPLLQEFAELFAETPASYLHLVNFRYGDPWGSNLLADGIQTMFLGDATPEEVAADIQTGVSQWFTPAGGAPEAAEPEPAEDVTLTLWSWRTEDEDAYNEIFDVYEAAHPGVTVEFVAFVNTDYNNILATGLTGEGGPDVAQLRAYGGIQPLIEAGQLMPLDGEVATLSNFPDAILKGATGQSDGHIYGVPFGVQAFTAYYNVDIFDELGLSEPQTWDEFIAVLDALKGADYIPIAAPAKDVWMLPLIHDAVAAPRYGGPDFEAEVLSGATDFNDPDYVASIGVIQDLQQYLPDDVVGIGYTDSKTLFLTEMAGVFLGGSFEVGFWRNEGPDLNLGVFRVPAPPESLTGPLVPGWMDGSYGVNALSDSPDAAKDLVEWMGTPEFGQMFTEKIKQLSAIPGMTPTDPLLQEFAALFAETPTSYLHLVNFRYGDPWGSNLLADGIQAMFLGDATPESIAADIQTGVSQWFTPGE